MIYIWSQSDLFLAGIFAQDLAPGRTCGAPVIQRLSLTNAGCPLVLKASTDGLAFAVFSGLLLPMFYISGNFMAPRSRLLCSHISCMEPSG